jgi:integrase
MPFRNNGKWIGQVRKDGHRIRRVFDSKGEAKEWESKQKKIPTEDWRKKTRSASSLGDWSIAYLKFSQAKHSAKTFQEKKTILKRFLKKIKPTMEVSYLSMAQVLAYLQAQARARSGHAANKDRKNLIAAWNWGIKYFGLPNKNPCLVDRFPEERSPRYIPPMRDLNAVLEASQGQERVMLLCYLHLAARRSELFRLRWEDIDFYARTVRLMTRKRMDGSQEYDSLPMTDALATALARHRETAIGDEWVFVDPHTGRPYQYRIHAMRRLCEASGVKYFGFHAIRHLTASLLANAGVPTIVIQAILRHKSIRTTEKYTPRLGDMKASLESAL